jgi:hypothetical protein
MQFGVKDIWFQSELPLDEIAQRLGLQDVIEDYWTWIIGRLANVKLDITRTHTQPPDIVETRIFEINHEEMTESLVADLARRLQLFVRGAVHCGRWWFLSGHEFDLEVFQTFAPPDSTNH